MGVHIHVAEDASDQADAVGTHGCRVVERLHAAGVVTDKALLAHCVHIDDNEARIIGACGATVARNARSNMNNAVGHSPASGGSVAIGTDGIGGDMITESQTAFFRAREASLATPPSWPLDRLAAGSRAAGRIFGEPLLGRIEPGAPADIMVLEYLAPAPRPRRISQGTGHSAARHARCAMSLCAGELVIADRLSTRIDMARLAAEAARESGRLWDRLERIPPHDFAPAGGAARWR